MYSKKKNELNINLKCDHTSIKMKAIDQYNINNSAEVLSRSFIFDPLFQYFFPDDDTREKLAFYTFRFIVSHAFKKGFVFGTSSAIEGVAVWLPSISINRNFIDQLRFGAISIYLNQGKDIVNRQITGFTGHDGRIVLNPHVTVLTPV